MLEDDDAVAARTEASPSSDQEVARHREKVIRMELERRIELFDQLEDAEFGRFGAIDWVVCTTVFFLLPLLVAWWAL